MECFVRHLTLPNRFLVKCARASGRALALLVAALPLVFATGGDLQVSASEFEYRVAAQDRLKIKVSEWRPNSRELFEWSALSGEFAVSSTGMLSLPVVGTFSVDGKAPAEIAALISERLKGTAGLVNAPAAAVEIAQYRPIYVVGAVEKPGEYAFRPTMTALQAVAIAGGFQRLELALGRFERETIIAEGEINVQQTQLLALQVRRDRLLAEARKAEAITFSDDIRRGLNDGAAQAMREENALFASRRKAARSQGELLQQMRSLLEEESRMLDAKAVTQQRQQDLIRRELNNINSLVSKGLAVSPRQLAVEQNLAQSESQALDLMLATARAKQEISRIDRTLSDLENQREIDIGRELRETQLSLRQTDDRIIALRALIQESTTLAPKLQNQQAKQLARMRFSVQRREGGAINEIAIEETSPILPGDIVRVERASLQSIISSLPPTAAGAQN
ncbi:polysaccharide export outer membrane protein/exopolysaccharide production protein ExoF [Bosea sp. BE125]|uniref:polysaccharide biosynthesis/export family protein n=1 Tax=Bosea sp. BE125 TaxID=2817909 RepID=UPI002855874E|nr:polysaccharide biosynthesis/export family protein [Bosea sp. BE125]MDR6873006.1 polysaccharide export outer membrane protein/exopolysaccharide production protein ExoF [Bosea sp. BE125]